MLLPVSQPALQLIASHGPGNEITLSKIAICGAQKMPIFFVFDTFRHTDHTQLTRHAQAAFKNGAQGIVVPGAVDKTLVNFELVKGYIPQLCQG